MKLTYKWLKEFAEFDYTPEELVEKLTMVGLEVDSCTSTAWDFDGVVVGVVTKKESHKSSDHLWVCEVDIGSECLSVVCGAPNVEVGQKVPVAVSGTTLPNGRLIRLTNIRGVNSQGMICSEAELGISSRGDGIMVLDSGVECGGKLSDVLGENETVIDIEVTPNRPDCFGVLGIAREVAALAGTQLRKPAIEVQESGHAIEELAKIEVLDSEKCPRYTARFIGEVEIKPSPWWLAHRLEAVGVRSINNVVDVTNYVMMETGQPLHAFDYDLLRGRQIKVRTADEGTEFTTLDGKKRQLSSEALMICDGEGEVAIGGVIGGENSEVSITTKNVLLESAYFDPVSVRRTAKSLDVSTEASRRFERGVDPNGVLYALDRAAQMIAELSDGRIAKGSIDVYPTAIKPKVVTLRVSRVNLLLGIEITAEKVLGILANLEFKVLSHNEDDIEVEVPTFRPDVKREADLIEEVARLYGFDKIPADGKAVIQQLAPVSKLDGFRNKVHGTLISLGFSRAVTYSILKKEHASPFERGENLVQVINPIGEEFSTLRPSILPGLLNVIRWNLNRGNENLKLFEIGTVFRKRGRVVEETSRLTGVLTGRALSDSWRAKYPTVDIHDAKGMVEALMDCCRVSPLEIPTKLPFTNSSTLRLEVDRTNIGFVAGIHEEVLSMFEIEQPVFVFDVNFSLLFESAGRQKTFQPIPKFPPINRDIAVTVEEPINAGSLLQEIKSNGGEFLHSVEVFDIFRGEQVGQRNKSIAFSLKFYSLERTLKEDEVDSKMDAILGGLATKFSARLRD